MICSGCGVCADICPASAIIREEAVNMKEKDPLNVIVTGVGGQGNVLISQLIGKALVKAAIT